MEMKTNVSVTILNEAGYEEAKYGFSLSYKDRRIPREEWWLSEKSKHYDIILKANANRGNGHNKFLRQIMLWVDIEAPRYWWSEFDTYKIGTVAQSESTMHTLLRRQMIEEDCVEGTNPRLINLFNEGFPYKKDDVGRAKANVPEGYLQRRVVTMNYEVVRTIIKQRKDHRLPEWRSFINQLVDQLDHPEFVEDLL